MNTSVCRVGKQQTSFCIITSRSGKIIFSLLVVNLYCHLIETTFIKVCLVLLIYFFSILTFECLFSFFLKFFHSERFFNFPFFHFLKSYFNLFYFLPFLYIGRVSSGMVAQKNRKLRIEKIGKIGDFALKNRRKIGKSKVLLSTKTASLHPVRVIIKATSPHILCSQDLDQLSQLRRSENDQ